MTGIIASELRRARDRAGLTQGEVARRMGTTQSVISRTEAGWVEPSPTFIERYAQAVGERITVTFGDASPIPDRRTRKARVRRALGDYVFDPWEREPSSAEIKSLRADGLTRERFEGRTAAGPRR